MLVNVKMLILRLPLKPGDQKGFITTITAALFTDPSRGMGVGWGGGGEMGGLPFPLPGGLDPAFWAGHMTNSAAAQWHFSPGTVGDLQV